MGVYENASAALPVGVPPALKASVAVPTVVAPSSSVTVQLPFAPVTGVKVADSVCDVPAASMTVMPLTVSVCTLDDRMPENEIVVVTLGSVAVRVA